MAKILIAEDEAHILRLMSMWLKKNGHEVIETNNGAEALEAIKAGVPGEAVRDEMALLEARKADLVQQRDDAPKPMPRLHPTLADVYRRKVDDLEKALNEEGTRAEASEAIRQLIDEVRLVPDDGTLKIELYGELAALIGLANEHPRSRGTGVQVTLVAGARFELATFRL